MACPICFALFGSTNALQDHIHNVHRDTRFYVTINNRVIPDMVYIGDSIEEMTATAIGTDCHAVMRFGERSQKVTLKAQDSTEFSAKIPNDYRGQIVLTVRVGTAYEREYRIFCNEMPNMDFVALDALVRHLQQPLLEDLEPDWSLFRSTYIQGMGSNPLETRYLRIL